MKLSRYKTQTALEGNVSFPMLQCWNPVTRCVSIAADVDGQRVLCRIADTVIEEVFGASALNAAGTVTANRKLVESASMRSIARSRVAVGGTIDVRTEDFANLAGA